jgi:signal transduction histidine kinase
MQIESSIFEKVKQRYPKRVGLIILLVAIFGVAGIIGSISIYQQQKNNNAKVNISGRQRFLSAMILLDLQKLESNRLNSELISSVNKRRKLFRESLDELNINQPQVIEGLSSSQFANEKTPTNADVYNETLNYFQLTDPTANLSFTLPDIREKQRQVIGAVWDIYTGKLAASNDLKNFQMVMFVVFCFSFVVALNVYAIAIILKVAKENREQKHILKNSSKFISIGEQTININHDMNNILSVINTSMFSLKYLLNDRPDLSTKFSVLEKSLARLTALTSALRRSILGGSDIILEENINAFEILDDCKTILRDKLKSNGVELIIDIPSDFTFNMRKDFLYQLLMNLISNSIEAVAMQENAWVKVQILNSGNEIQLRVMDSGKGLSQDIKEKLFTPFFTTKNTGTGLGLNYLRKMAEEMNAQLIYDDSFINTCFVFKFLKKELSAKL